MTYIFLPEPNNINIATLVVLSFVKGCVNLSFEKKSKMICYPHYLLASPKNISVITPLQNMHPPPIYPQLSHLHNHGLAMLVCITPLRNASTVSILKPFEKKLLKKWFSPQVSSKPLKRWSKKKKLQEPIQIKGKLTFCEGKDNSTSKILFVVISFSPPPSYHFKNPFQIHWESFLNSFQSIL
jgi:hypothetical protein